MSGVSTIQKNYTDQNLRELQSTVTDIHHDGGKWLVQLDATIFYPEGGGQPGDRGDIAGIEVVDTRKREGEILHIMAHQPSFRVGDSVLCRLDWERRFDYMQQHTGQHILSGVMYSLFGIQTVSVHQGEDYLTIETDRELMSDDEIRAVEDEANRVITTNIPVTTETVHESEVEKLSLRRAPKVEGTIRLVRIGKHDLVACGGMHTAASGEVGLVLWIQSEMIRGHVRLYWKVGMRAYEDFRLKTSVTRRLTELFSTPLGQLPEKAEVITDQLRSARSEIADLENRTAARIVQQAVSQKTEDEVVVIAGDYSDKFPGIMKLLVKNLPAEKKVVFCGVQRQDDETLLWAVAASEPARACIDFQKVKEHLLPLIHGKGGGRPPVWQGMGTRVREAERFLSRFREMVAEC